MGVRALPPLVAPGSVLGQSVLGAALLRVGLASPLVATRSLLGRSVLGTALLCVGLASPLVVISAVDAVATLTEALAMSKTASTGDAGRGRPALVLSWRGLVCHRTKTAN